MPYPVFAVSGMVMWLYFTGAISLSSESTVASAQLISKVYFPRIIIPVAGVVLPLTDFALGLVVVIGVTLAYGIVPPVQVVLIPLLNAGARRFARHLTLVAAHTVMSKGVPFMEKDGYKWHGAALPVDKCHEALAILGAPDDLDHWISERKKPAPDWHAALPHRPDEAVVLPSQGTPRTYTTEKSSDNRGAFGGALEDLGAVSGGVPMAVLDCDLLKSTKTDLFAARYPKSFFQGGIAEHNAAVLAGALSLAGIAAWWGEFGMFGVAEAYNQQRLNDVNEANVKLAVTHSGIDVGEDGKTHHSIDYFGSSELHVRLEGLHAGRSEPDRPHHALDGDAPGQPRARHGALEVPGRPEGRRHAVLRGRLRLRPREGRPPARRVGRVARVRGQHAAVRDGRVERAREGRDARGPRVRGRVERPLGRGPRAHRAARPRRHGRGPQPEDGPRHVDPGAPQRPRAPRAREEDGRHVLLVLGTREGAVCAHGPRRARHRGKPSGGSPVGKR